MLEEKAIEKQQKLPDTMMQAFRDSIQEVGIEAQLLMVDNLSGRSVSFSGGSFVINVQTGNLRRLTRMEYPLEGNPLSVGIFNRASYAEQIDTGISGAEKVAQILNGGKPAKVSKKGKRYKRIKFKDGFLTVSEDSPWKNQKARPFVAATAEQVGKKIDGIFEEVFEEALENLE